MLISDRFYNGEAKATPACFTGASFVHPVKPVEDIGKVRLRNSNASVSNYKENIVTLPNSAYMNLTTTDIVLDGIFYMTLLYAYFWRFVYLHQVSVRWEYMPIP